MKYFIMILKIRSLSQLNADNLYKKQKIEGQIMMLKQPQMHDYYGYNSIINTTGKRIRRMRRTQASVEKLLQSRMRSPDFTRSPSSRRSILDKKDYSRSLNCILSNCISKSKDIIHTKQKNNESYHSMNNFSQLNSNLMNSQNKKDITDVRLTMGQYYIDNIKIKQQKISKKLQKVKSTGAERGTKNLKFSKESQNKFQYHSNNTSRRTLRKTEKNNDFINPFELENNNQKSTKLVASKRQPIFEKITTNSKLKQSKISLKNKQQSYISRSQVSSNHKSSKSNLLVKKNHVKFQQQISSQIKKIQDEQSKSVKKSQNKISKKSSVNIKLPSQISDFSKDNSHISIIAQRIRSKIKEKYIQSKISQIFPFQQDTQNKLQKNVKIVKKSTETTQSNRSHENSVQLKSNKIINGEMTPKISKKRTIQENQSRISSIKMQNKKNEIKVNPEFLANQVLNSSRNQSQLSSVPQRSSIKNTINLPSPKNGQVHEVLKISKKKSVNSYTFNDVVQNIEEHEIRLGSLLFFIDSTKNRYETPIKFERYQKLCFLILKKYVFEQKRLINALKGGQNCFILTNAQIPTQVLKLHMNRLQVRERLNIFIEQSKQIEIQKQKQFEKIQKKYPKDKYIKNEMIRDNFSPQIMRHLMQQLTKLYQQLQKQDIQNDIIDGNEQRIIQIIEIMFLLSQLSGRPVKQFQLFQENLIDFEEYYAQYYQTIMETAQYFQKYI